MQAGSLEYKQLDQLITTDPMQLQKMLFLLDKQCFIELITRKWLSNDMNTTSQECMMFL